MQTEVPIVATPPDSAARTLLGGLDAVQFMRRHWQKKPLLVRGALPDAGRLMPPRRLLELAGHDMLRARLVCRQGERFSLGHGPFARRRLPALRTPGWTVLVQGVDLVDEAIHALMQRFRFVPDARLDDVMLSFASDQGGVGPHVDSYDVFLLQLHGQRRWRIGRQKNHALLPGLPLRILADFVPEEEWLLGPGDMLYLPPMWAHDGVAQGPCVTASIGFRAPARELLTRELLGRLADQFAEDETAEDETGNSGPLYRDARQPAVQHPGHIPPALHAFARDALHRALKDEAATGRALGEWLSEPRPEVWFEAREEDAPLDATAGVTLDRKTRMLYDARHIFINGEAWRASGADQRLMQRLADRRRLGSAELRRASARARELLARWHTAGWLHRAAPTKESAP